MSAENVLSSEELRIINRRGIYALYDRKAYQFLPIFEAPTDETAVRMLSQSINKDNPLMQFSGDYFLYRLGFLDNDKLSPDRQNLGLVSDFLSPVK